VEGALVGGSGAATSEHPGQIVVIDFWATYCPPCIKSLPRLQVLQDRYAGKVHILAVSEDEELEVIPPFLSRTDVRLPVVWDKGKVMGDRYGVDSLPQTFVLDRKGVVRFVHLEYDEGELAALEAELRQLLAE
jgi:thiol-disulfide isomerase/thioredoxin